MISWEKRLKAVEKNDLLKHSENRKKERKDREKKGERQEQRQWQIYMRDIKKDWEREKETTRKRNINGVIIAWTEKHQKRMTV